MKRVLISAGEVSGDHHAAFLMLETLKFNPKIHFYGMGGAYMQKAGADIIIDAKQMAVVGITEIIMHLPVIIRAYIKMRKLLKVNPPDLLVLVDYSGFNLKLAKIAKRFGIKVLYYISPHVWIWRKYRIRTICKCVTKMAVILPFEVEFYRKHQVDVSYVGNPTVAKTHPSMLSAQVFESLGLSSDKTIIGLLPGSRMSEIKSLMPILIKTAKLLQQRYSNCQFILPLASSLTPDDLQSYLTDLDFQIKIVSDRLYDILQICNVAITASGTVTLEIALIGIPLVIIYKLSPLTYAIGKMLIKINSIGLCNLIAGKNIAKELIQHNANPQAISEEVFKIIENKNYNQQMRIELKKVKELLIKGHEIESVGKIVNTMLKDAIYSGD